MIKLSFFLIVSAVVNENENFLRCQKRSLLTLEAKTKARTHPGQENLTGRKCSPQSKASKLKDISCHELHVKAVQKIPLTTKLDFNRPILALLRIFLIQSFPKYWTACSPITYTNLMYGELVSLSCLHQALLTELKNLLSLSP